MDFEGANCLAWVTPFDLRPGLYRSSVPMLSGLFETLSMSMATLQI